MFNVVDFSFEQEGEQMLCSRRLTFLIGIVHISFGLCGSSMRSKTIILWGQFIGEAGTLLDPCGGSVLHEYEAYLTRVDTRSDLILKRFPIIKKEKKEKKCT
jgi:hypothetical protein